MDQVNENQYISIAQITPQTLKWTAKVQMIERPRARDSRPRTPESRTTRYRTIIVADDEGTWMQCVLFGQAIEAFQHTLQPFKTYEISNATVRELPDNYRIV